MLDRRLEDHSICRGSRDCPEILISNMLNTRMHASSVETRMHKIRLLSFLRSFFAEKARAHRELISAI